MNLVEKFMEKKKEEYIQQGYTQEDATKKALKIMKKYMYTRVNLFKHQGLKHKHENFVPYLDTGSEKWYVDIDYETNQSYLFHNTINTEKYHFQKKFKNRDSIIGNLIDICHYIRDHSFRHIHRDFTNTLLDKFDKIKINGIINNNKHRESEANVL
jgi:hypothetical protein